MDYLVYAYLQGGQAGAAQGVLDRMANVTLEDKARTLPFDYALAAAPARFALEQRRWHDAAALTPLASRFPATRALTHYARALGAAHLGKLQDAGHEIAQLTQIHDALLQGKQDYWAKQVDLQRQTAEAWLAWAAGNSPRAVELMRGTVDTEESTYKHPITPGQLLPARELMGDLLLEIGQPGQALAEYETALRFNPNRFNALYGAARAAELAGLAAKAGDYYRQLLELCQSADGERPELRRAKLFLASR
jgi:tetratricopeptide (TPR) repeat protein